MLRTKEQALSDSTENSESTVRELAVGDLPDHVRTALDVLDEFQGREILVMAVGEVLGIVEYFIVASAPNSRLVRKLVDEVQGQLKSEHDEPPIRVEGHDTFQWVLIDYGDFVVHVMLDETRRLYELERLWSDVPIYRRPASSRPEQAPEQAR